MVKLTICGQEQSIRFRPLADSLLWWRLWLAWLPGFCRYCGQRRVRCSRGELKVLFPVRAEGRCCPDGHEGYVDQFYGYATIRYYFDAVRYPPDQDVVEETSV